MALTAKRRHSPPSRGSSPAPPRARLGIDQPAGWWPSAPRLKSYEAAGFAHVQVALPPLALLADEAAVCTHAGALAERLGLTELRLILRAPDDLIAGTSATDAALDGALRYAAVAGADLLVLPGGGLPAGQAGLRERLAAERRALRGRLGRAARNGVRLAFENLSPAYPGCERLGDDPGRVAELARQLDSPGAGICLDIGSAHIAAERTGVPLGELIAPLLGHVLVFHVSDNFGAAGPAQPGWIEPLRLELQLPPGAGSVPWPELAPLIDRHAAPVVVEVHPSARPEPGTLAAVTRELLRPARESGGVA